MKEEISSENVFIVDALELYKNKVSVGHRDKEYISSEKWKCISSPTKSHHWLLNFTRIKQGFLVTSGICKYCNKNKIIVSKI